MYEEVYAVETLVFVTLLASHETYLNDANTLTRHIGMTSNNKRQTAAFAMATFCMLMYMYCINDTVGSGQYVSLVPLPLSFVRKTTTANQKDISEVREWVHKPYVVSYSQNENNQSESIQTQINLNDRSKNTAVSGEGVHFKENATQSIRETTCVKQIQFWGRITLSFPGGTYDCPAENCKARFVQSQTYEKMRTSHVVILHHKGYWNWEELARYRPEGQMWIYMTKESPLHSHKANSPDPEHLAFNWTMTYQTDSDFVIPYGTYTENVSEISADDNRNWATGKTRLVAWMASNCGVASWGRTSFVKNLKTLIQVDTYGKCGTLKCPRNENCDEILSSHKFYLALENSECEDYITEKFWKNAYLLDLVPIVYGATRKDYEKVAPPNSFIHLSDFDNMTSLVDYLKYLDKNDTAYNEYFDWKKKGSVSWYREVDVPMKPIMCNLIRRLKELDNLEQVTERKNIMINLNSWKSTSCHRRQNIWSTKP